MTDHDKNKELTYLKYLNVNSLLEWEIPQNFLVNAFKWVENTSQFHKNFMKSYNKDSDKGYFPEVIYNILKKYMIFLIIYSFYLKERKLRKLKNL